MEDKKNFELLYEGKAKKVYKLDEEKLLINFKDDVTAFNGLKKDQILNKGRINKEISKFFFEMLNKKGISTHYINDYDENSFVAEWTDLIPLEVIIRNYTAGSFCERYGVKKGLMFDYPLVEFSLKNDELGDPMITKDAIILLKITTEDVLNNIISISKKVNDILRDYLKSKRIILVDFKLEFGISKKDNKLTLIDEISPDTCRFWDANTMESLDKDVYREEKGDLINTYEVLLGRLDI
ncbi:phosphoribosylaminoimidazolesuccinocarboxamide synthase [Petrotoga olearia]|uniref:Phosphoribosylaminoimidazole-succinocarboxamide synthase n=2 Tax=Petrotoga olearia TaxID=156203 RepID=A0A2K1NYA3_9BACT|nr:phosphoribosylaminoimidazolesuccinocarboxamide synthase [Petrotoga olearia]PNR95514.1 phosphoribosylaminoimidazole-succinocarboxamide synthase [Petrotoga olearia DSM 13574]RMA71380.1 phosphoribosylaminoimidazole-succinocarboxamide synthase [Petrotoga olearia]